jgi:excisionase family DNA binding protein
MDKKLNKNQIIKQSQGICNPQVKRLYNLKEAAFYLGRSDWGMRDLVWKGAIAYVQDGRRYYFDLNDLDKYISKNKKECST